MNNQRARADLLSEQRRQITRLGETLEALARDAHRRKAPTQINHALDGLEALTELARTLTQLMKQLTQELQPTETEPNQ